MTRPAVSPADLAEAEQRAASDPLASAFVSAHAGTGKTKLLIDRLLRLMLEGADPARILCLTFTKAAAAEMAIRLQRRLGEWVTLGDTALDEALAALPAPIGHDMRSRARALFAQVLDLPGGMRIGTIHAFCQSLVRRFPLEAQISPHFRLIEPADARADLEAAREHALPQADPAALAVLAGLVTADGFAGLVAQLEADRERLAAALALPPAALQAAMRRVVGATGTNAAQIVERAVSWADEGYLAQQLELASQHGTDKIREKALCMLGWLLLPLEERKEHWEGWIGEFMRDGDVPRGLGAFANPNLEKLHPGIRQACAAEQERILGVLDQLRALHLAEASVALLRLAAPILADFAATKERGALVDYSDLIGRTATLLGAGSAWVLFKLDGGLDHLLLDEVQDTARVQWNIADSLTADFFTGAGARDEARRTIFAVGDRKQSIYSFQGAEPEEFDRWRGIFGRRVTEAGQVWRPTVLDVSFRSSAPVLALVDAVFADPEAADGVCEPGTLKHIANRAGHAGRVELWPLAPRPDAAEHTPWTIPERNQSQTNAPETLVAELARWIAAEIAGGYLRAGDILVLVRRRGDFDRGLVRALKGAGVPVAGLDRMMLTEQPAVADLLSLCDSLLLPQDDLTFAEMLVSPLGGLSDDSLMQLALGAEQGDRKGSLREALRGRAQERPDWAQAEAFFAALLRRVDYAAPHALLTEALGALGGRARLFARLGPQAAEPIDELLAEAMRYTASHPPSLQGFVHWLRLAGAEVKREPEAAGDAVRIMTVHGAKGLEAPLVILPDTTSLPPDDRGLTWARDPDTGVELPLWAPNKDLNCDALKLLRTEGEQGRMREYHRLLYVALTRARDRILICGWQTARENQGSWYKLVMRGMESLVCTAAPFTAWPGDLLAQEAPQTQALESRRTAAAAAPGPVPNWAGRAPHWQAQPLPPEPAVPRPLAPSRPEGVDLGPVPPQRSPLAATAGRDRFGRGLLVHALLQHLPDLPEPDRQEAAERHAASSTVNGAAALAAQAVAVLASPELAPLFAPGSRAEQPIVGLVGAQVVTGQVDRLAVLPDAVLIADYKTSRAPPASPEATPVLYLRQMAAYRAVLRLLYPDRPVRCTLIWTEGPNIMHLPDPLLDLHAPGTQAPGTPPPRLIAPLDRPA